MTADTPETDPLAQLTAFLASAPDNTATLPLEVLDQIHDALTQARAENLRLREELGQLDADLDTRMKALGMYSMGQIMGNNKPLDRFMNHAGVSDLDSFFQWLANKTEYYTRMRLRYETGQRPKDDEDDAELLSWIFAHSAAFKSVLGNFRQAMERSGQSLD